MRTRSGCYPSTAGDVREKRKRKRQMTTGEGNGKELLRIPTGAPFDDLPDDLLISILSKLSSRAECPAEFFNVLRTCKRFNKLGFHQLVLSTASTGTLPVNQSWLGEAPIRSRAASRSRAAYKFWKRCADAGNTNTYGFTFGEVGFFRASTVKIVCCDFSSDGKLLASGGHDKKVVMWNMDNLKVSTLEKHSFMITDVRFSTNSTLLARSSFDRTVKLWDTDKPSTSLCTFTGHSGAVMSLDFDPKNKDRVCSCDENGEIRYWNVTQGVCTKAFKFWDSQGRMSQLRFQPRLGLFLAAAINNVVTILDVETGTSVHSLQGHITTVHYVCWDASGNYLASVSEESVRVWNFGSGGDVKFVQNLDCTGNKFYSCVFHPKHQLLLVIGCYQSLELWNIAENRSMTISAQEGGIIVALAASEATGRLVSASHDKYVKLWE